MFFGHPNEEHRYCKTCQRTTLHKRRKSGREDYWYCTKCGRQTPHRG